MNVLTSSEQIDQAWLAGVLRRSGALTQGNLIAFGFSAAPSTNAQIARIYLEYSEGAQGRLPPSVILKMCTSDNLFVADSEVNFYSRDYLALPDAPIPHCYDAQFSSTTGSYHILMDDLSETHAKDSDPSLEYGKTVAKSLAALHAHGWGIERIHTLGEQIPGQERIARFANHVEQGLAPLLDVTEGQLSGDQQSLIRQVFKRYPAKILARTSASPGFAVLHGDLNPGNILSPKTRQGLTYFLDRQPFRWSLTTWLAVSDLVIMMIPYWPIEARRTLEMPILHEYHRQLILLGVTDYEWEQLLLDYRLTAIQSLYIAAEWCIKKEDRERMRWVWWQELQNSVAAILDLQCMELLS